MSHLLAVLCMNEVARGGWGEIRKADVKFRGDGCECGESEKGRQGG